MLQLIDHVQNCTKSAPHADGTQYVRIEHNGAVSRRKIQYRYFSNYAIEFINWGGKKYQVNTVKERQYDERVL